MIPYFLTLDFRIIQVLDFGQSEFESYQLENDKP